MFVCICMAVNEKRIAEALNQGCNTLKALREETGAMSQCGKCALVCKQILTEHTLTRTHCPSRLD